MEILGYSERGLMNSLLFEMGYSRDSLALLAKFLGLAKFLSSKQNFLIKGDPIVLIEHSFSDFGNADAVLLLGNIDKKQTIFIEAKVKTFLRKSWSIKEEFDKFEEGIKSKVSSSNLFMQLYLKQALMRAFQEKEIRDLQKNGLPFPRCSSKNPRRLGNNEVVKRVAEILQRYSQSVHYIAIVPDEAQKAERFFEEKLRNYRPPGFEYWNTADWGYMTWEAIEDFCDNHDLRETLRAFKHNECQIYQKKK